MDPKSLVNNKFRKQAEEIALNKSSHVDGLSKDELIEELRIHQIELELQNDKLRQSEMKLNESQNKYFELYNFAPVGYLTLDDNGLIFDTNLAGADLLGVERKKLIGQAFIRITKEYQNKFYQIIKKPGIKNNIELKLQKFNKKSFYAYLEIINIYYPNGNLKESRITITNIDELENTKTALEINEGYREIL